MKLKKKEIIYFEFFILILLLNVLEDTKYKQNKVNLNKSSQN